MMSIGIWFWIFADGREKKVPACITEWELEKRRYIIINCVVCCRRRTNANHIHRACLQLVRKIQTCSKNAYDIIQVKMYALTAC